MGKLDNSKVLGRQH